VKIKTVSMRSVLARMQFEMKKGSAIASKATSFIQIIKIVKGKNVRIPMPQEIRMEIVFAMWATEFLEEKRNVKILRVQMKTL
jgi:hypothetical protein